MAALNAMHWCWVRSKVDALVAAGKDKCSIFTARSFVLAVAAPTLTGATPVL
jgi:hypothetical protein